MCVVDSQLRNVVTCPACGKTFVVEDIHRPFRCPHCGALLSYDAPLGKVFVLLSPDD